MKNLSTTIKVLACAIFIMALSTLAQAQATRTWVSGVGNDQNPCSRTAPCKTWAGAISKTAAGGEMNALDPGGYGTLTVTKSVTVDGGTGAGWASTLATNAPGGFIINDSQSGSPNTIVVHLRNLSFNGAGNPPGVDGIRFLSGKTLYVENCRIFRFSGDGIEMTTGTLAQLYVRNTVISDCGGDGIRLTSNVVGQFNTATLENVELMKCGNGVNVTDRSRLVMRGGSAVHMTSAIAGNGGGVKVGGGGNDIIVHLIGTNLSHNTTGIIANGGAVRIGNVYITNNATSITGAANVASWSDSMIVDNGANNQPGAPDLIKQ
jgi:hypothetical protein